MARLTKVPASVTELAELLERRARGGYTVEHVLRTACRLAADVLRANPGLVLPDAELAPAPIETEFPLQEYLDRRPPKLWFAEPPPKPDGN